MIICRKIKTHGEIEILEDILRYYNIKDVNNENSIIYIIEENDKIIGGSSIMLYNNYGLLKYLVIDNNRTGEDLGDGLLRAILNYCYLNDIKKVFYPSTNTYLLKKGFISNIPDEINSNDNIQNSSKLVCFIQDFFNHGCKAKRG